MHAHPPTTSGSSSSRLFSFCFASCIAGYVAFGTIIMLVLLATFFKVHTDRTLYEYSYSAALATLPSANLQVQQQQQHQQQHQIGEQRPAIGTPDDLATATQRDHFIISGNASSPLPSTWFDPPLQSTLSGNFYVKPAVRCVALPPGVNYVFVAANLHNSEEVLPVWLREMKRFLLMVTGCDKTEQELEHEEGGGSPQQRRQQQQKHRGGGGPSIKKSRVFVSVFTNACADRTNEILADNFLVWLERHNIPHNLNINGKIDGKFSRRPNTMDRIQWLSRVRNTAIAPLVQHGARVFLTPQSSSNDKHDAQAMLEQEQRMVLASGGGNTLHRHGGAGGEEVSVAEKAEMMVESILEADQWNQPDDNDDDEAKKNKKKKNIPAGEDVVDSGAIEADEKQQQQRESAAERQAEQQAWRKRQELDLRRLSSQLPSLSDIRLLFINDIVFTAEDLLLLLHTNGGNFDMVCGMDYYFNFYDTWVARDVTGRPFWPAPPYSQESALSQGVQRLSPVKVGCCWNGAVVAKARVFVTENFDEKKFDISMERFKKRYQHRRKNSNKNEEEEEEPTKVVVVKNRKQQQQHKKKHEDAVAETILRRYFFRYAPNIVFRWSCLRCCLSECSLLCRDLRRKEFGDFSNILMNPLVRVGYETPGYASHRGTSFVVDFFEATAWIWAEFNKNFVFEASMGFANATEGAIAFAKLAAADSHPQDSSTSSPSAAVAVQQQQQQQHAEATPAPPPGGEKVRMTSGDDDSVVVYAPQDDEYEACFSAGPEAAAITRYIAIEAVSVGGAGLIFLSMAVAMLVRYLLYSTVPVFLSWRFFQMLRMRSVSRFDGSDVISVLFPSAFSSSGRPGGIVQRLKWLWFCCFWCSTTTTTANSQKESSLLGDASPMPQPRNSDDLKTV